MTGLEDRIDRAYERMRREQRRDAKILGIALTVSALGLIAFVVLLVLAVTGAI